MRGHDTDKRCERTLSLSLADLSGNDLILTNRVRNHFAFATNNRLVFSFCLRIAQVAFYKNGNKKNKCCSDGQCLPVKNEHTEHRSVNCCVLVEMCVSLQVLVVSVKNSPSLPLDIAIGLLGYIELGEKHSNVEGKW